MFEGYKKLQNAHALRSLLHSPVMPNPNLAVACDDEMSNIPLVIFRDQHLPMPQATLPDVMSIPYEKAVPKGSGETLSLEDFVTDDFELGAPFDSLI